MSQCASSNNRSKEGKLFGMTKSGLRLGRSLFFAAKEALKPAFIVIVHSGVVGCESGQQKIILRLEIMGASLTIFG